MHKRDAFCKVKATEFNVVESVSPMFNVAQLQETLWVEADRKYIDSEYNLVHVFPFSDTSTDLFDHMRSVDNNSPWFEFPKEVLDTSIGHHVYELVYENMYTHEIQNLYFAYTIQDDHPETKNYIYMEAVRHEEDSEK